MRRVIARARLCVHLKHWRCTKNNMLCLIEKALTRNSCVFICYFIGSVVKIVLSKAATGDVLYKKVFLKLAKFTEKYKCQSLFFNKFAGVATSLLTILT